MEPTEIRRQCFTCLHGPVSTFEEPCLSCIRPVVGSHTNWTPNTPPVPSTTTPAPTTAAIKHDSGKPRYDLIPPEPLDGLARLYGMGAEKYEDRNWEKGMKWSRIFAAMMRHAWKWFRGETYDQEDGQHHLLSVIWCAMALYTYQVRREGLDDRPWPLAATETYEAVWRQIPTPEKAAE